MTQQHMQRWSDPIYSAHRRIGPETEIEDVVVADLPRLLSCSESPSCIFGSRPIGAGAPDLTIVYCVPNVSIPEIDPTIVDVLAYLRVVNQARSETLLDRLRIDRSVLNRCLDALVEAGALRRQGDVLALDATFRDPLREIVTVEAKVSKWRDAVTQAARNRVFAHRSFVALPEPQARLAAEDDRVALLGIGVISIVGSGARLARRPRRSRPRVWRYYFELAIAAARHLRLQNAVHSSDTAGAGSVPAV